MQKVTLETTLGQILDEPQAKAVLDQYLPGVSSNPMISMVRNMTLNMILAMPQAAQFGITKDMVEKILVDINKNLGL